MTSKHPDLTHYEQWDLPTLDQARCLKPVEFCEHITFICSLKTDHKGECRIFTSASFLKELKDHTCQPSEKAPKTAVKSKPLGLPPDFRGLCGSCRHRVWKLDDVDQCSMPITGSRTMCPIQNPNGDCPRWQPTRWASWTRIFRVLSS